MGLQTQTENKNCLCSHHCILYVEARGVDACSNTLLVNDMLPPCISSATANIAAECKQSHVSATWHIPHGTHCNILMSGHTNRGHTASQAHKNGDAQPLICALQEPNRCRWGLSSAHWAAKGRLADLELPCLCKYLYLSK